MHGSDIAEVVDIKDKGWSGILNYQSIQHVFYDDESIKTKL
jgi:hypothetical protein